MGRSIFGLKLVVPERTKLIISGFFVSLIVILIFNSSLGNEFTNLDDFAYVTKCDIIKDLSFRNITKIFTSFHLKLYKPLTLLSFAVEHHFFKLNPFVYHFNNLVLHIMNCLLVLWMVYLLRKGKKHKKLF